MKTTLFTLAALFIASTSFAQSTATLPTGLYSGFVNNQSFGRDLCNLNHGEIEFTAASDGAVNVRWQEEGFFQYPGQGFCQRIFDSTFTPAGANQWNVNFHYGFDWSFGKAVLNGDILTITANYTGSNRAYQSLNVRIRLNQNHSLQYSRTINLWGGPSLYASGMLY